MTAISLPPLDDAALGALALAHLERMVAIDSQSDEASPTIPSTPGQQVLADAAAAFFASLGAAVERDAHANVIATLPGRGARASAPPLALMVHLDTARGTRNVPKLNVLRAWDGRPLPYPANPSLQVGTDTYPALAEFLGQDVVFGPGDAPFGLDDKLGLAHLMTLARVLADHPDLPHAPLLLIGRPDEEVGRMEAVVGLADTLAARGVRSGYTVDGILPFEVNVENFNAAAAAVHFPDRPLPLAPDATAIALHLGGVNTHGATAHAEGSRSATRLAAELLAALGPDATALSFASDAVRDCDAELVLALTGPSPLARAEAACAAIIGPHRPRGASFTAALAPALDPAAASAATADALAFVARFLASDPGYPLAAEDSHGRMGYSAPYRARPDRARGGVTVDVRLRDFDPDALETRKRHVLAVAAASPGATATVADQYINMGPRLAERPELMDWAVRAAEVVGVVPRRFPIRGGTGVDPFLARGVAVANLGTGYFAPESEKELTSLQMMARHARWLVALVATAG